MHSKLSYAEKFWEIIKSSEISLERKTGKRASLTLNLILLENWSFHRNLRPKIHRKCPTQKRNSESKPHQAYPTVQILLFFCFRLHSIHPIFKPLFRMIRSRYNWCPFKPRNHTLKLTFSSINAFSSWTQLKKQWLNCSNLTYIPTHTLRLSDRNFSRKTMCHSKV